MPSTACQKADTAFEITPELLQRFDVAGLRDPSYPPADRFTEGFGVDTYLQAAAGRDAARPLSVYVHIPFCDSICYYCACNKVVTRDRSRADPYLDALAQEMALHLEALGTGRPVSLLHLGGGTPTYLTDAQLQRLMASLRGAFDLQPDAEMSVEADPRTVTPERLALLAGLGFNHVSFGVQDFEPAVQQAVHRIQPFHDVRALVDAARVQGFESINVDLIHGLPLQTPESFARTVDLVAGLRPDRIALYAYTHLPQRFKPQRRIADADLPSAADRAAMRASAISAFARSGYDHIGMDHFALPGDALAVARRQGRLHCNFQGYTPQPEGDLLALGVSAIGRMGDTQVQNAGTLHHYYEALNQGRLPVERGLSLTGDDRLRRDVIMALTCRGRLEFEAIERAHGISVREYFRAELSQLAPLAAEGLVTLEIGAVQLTALGWHFVRTVTAVFDGRLQARREPGRFSRVA